MDGKRKCLEQKGVRVKVVCKKRRKSSEIADQKLVELTLGTASDG